jgi:predicted GIY-YIG superfamily endonuclease
MSAPRFTIYVVTDDEGREYVGCTGQSVDVRFAHHCGNSRYVGGPHSLGAAIRRKGADRFRVAVLAEGLTFEQACVQEREAIVARGSLFPNGYNLRVTRAGLTNSRWARAA